jgi:hypothetical protein
MMKNFFAAVEDFQLQLIQTVTSAIHSLLPKGNAAYAIEKQQIKDFAFCFI